MAAEPPYFEEAKAAGRIIVTDHPKFELDSYIANYRGKTRIRRLHHIGTHSTQLYLEALTAAIAEAKRGKDVRLYEAMVSALREIVPEDPRAILDIAWVDRTTKEVKLETDRLELELKGYKNNLIKESIRMGCEDLGRHYHLIGDLSNAIKAYSKERESVQTPAHVAIMNMHLMHVSIDQGNWLSVQSSVQKLRSLPGSASGGEVDSAQPKLAAAMGLAQMATGSYKDAALSFLGADPRMLQAKLDDPNDSDAYNEILSPNDIAVYGGLCALASMDRHELQTRVLDNSAFRNYLELEPHVRRAVSFFVASKYSACLRILDAYRADYLLDLHLHAHVPEIYFRVRSKAIVQYFIPFARVTLAALAAAFNTDEASIERTLADMIGAGALDARLDLEHRVLLARHVDDRRQVHAAALATATDYERTLQLRLLRMEIVSAGLEVKSAPGKDLLSMGSLTGGARGGPPGLAGDVFMAGDGKGKGKHTRSGGVFP
ncbi:hypothetical protein MMC34_001198 [Xylographa carneopallida]|nr:hypothetical protein [Xylographa carneopallida]